MTPNAQTGRFETLVAWESWHCFAHTNSADPFWQMDHMNLRGMSRHAINEPIMIEKMWDWMGPLEHAWFSQFMPDVRTRYPLETERVNPWNSQMAILHYGLAPAFNSAVIDSGPLKMHPIAIENVLPAWLEQRKKHVMPTNCWQLTAELIAAYHSRDALPLTRRFTYHADVEERDMKTLQVLCPSPDWPLALACAGIASSSIKDAFKNGSLNQKEQQALAWLQWWLGKGPDCLDNLIWTWVRKAEDFVPNVEPATAMLLELSQGARDPRDTFHLARQVYGDMKPCFDETIDRAVFSLD